MCSLPFVMQFNERPSGGPVLGIGIGMGFAFDGDCVFAGQKRFGACVPGGDYLLPEILPRRPARSGRVLKLPRSNPTNCV